MVHLRVVPVANIHRPVRPGLDVHRAKPAVAGLDRVTGVLRLERRSDRSAVAHHHPTLNRLHPENPPEKSFGQTNPLVDDEVVREARHLVVWHGVEITKRIRVAQRPVLAESLPQVAALHVVKPPGVAAVVSGVDPTLCIELHAEGVAAALREHLISTCLRVIPPDVLAHGKNLILIETGPGHLGRHRAALRRVEPAVRPPAQAIDHRVRVLQPESGQVHNRIAVRNVVSVFVRIKKQIRRIQHPDPATAVSQRGRDVKAVDEGFVPVKHAIAVGVLVDGNLVASANVVGRRRRHLVVDRTPVVVATGHPETSRVRVLLILHNPHAAPLVEVQENRLLNQRLGEELIQLEVIEHLKLLERFSRRMRPGQRLAKRNQTGKGQQRFFHRNGRKPVEYRRIPAG